MHESADLFSASFQCTSSSQVQTTPILSPSCIPHSDLLLDSAYYVSPSTYVWMCVFIPLVSYIHINFITFSLFTPKIYAQPMNTITVQQRCVCVAVYFAYSSLFLLLSLCHNVSCVLPMPKEHRLYTVLLLPTLDNPNDNIFWSQKSTEHRRDNTYEKLLQKNSVT